MFRRVRIDSCERVVEKQVLGVGIDCPGKGNSSLLAATDIQLIANGSMTSSAYLKETPLAPISV